MVEKATSTCAEGGCGTFGLSVLCSDITYLSNRAIHETVTAAKTNAANPWSVFHMEAAFTKPVSYLRLFISFSSWLCRGETGGREHILYQDHLPVEAPLTGLQTYI